MDLAIDVGDAEVLDLSGIACMDLNLMLYPYWLLSSGAG